MVFVKIERKCAVDWTKTKGKKLENSWTIIAYPKLKETNRLRQNKSWITRIHNQNSSVVDS